MFRTQQIAQPFHSILAKAPLRMRLALAAAAVVGSAQIGRAQVAIPRMQPIASASEQPSAGEILTRVMDGMSNPDPETRFNAAWALADMGQLVDSLNPQTKYRFQQDVSQRYVREQDPQVRVRMARTIYKLMGTGMPGLAQRLQAREVSTRQFVVGLLSDLSAGMPEAIPLLQNAAQQDPDERVRNAAIGALEGTDLRPRPQQPAAAQAGADTAGAPREGDVGDLSRLSNEELMAEWNRLFRLNNELHTQLSGMSQYLFYPKSYDQSVYQAVQAKADAVWRQYQAVSAEIDRRPKPELSLEAWAARTEAMTRANAQFHNAQQSVTDGNRKMREWDKEMKYQEMSHRHE